MNKLREYQGVTYRDDVWWYEGVGYDSAIHLLHLANWGSDADHAALMDLKANPYEPTPTLEQIIVEYTEEIAYTMSEEEEQRYMLDICARLREAFPQIDAPLTAADHIAALVAMGAQEIKDVLSIEHRGSTSANLKWKDVLILPLEMTP
jgi:hypothetical protein